jgi:hypothetical protein
LEVFEPEDADWFFGRERLTSTLVAELAGRYHRGGLLVAIGVSGSGKSSLLRAGLIPAIRRGDLAVRGSQSWPCLLFTPGEHPLQELATKLAAPVRAEPADVEGMLQSDPRATVGLARRACGAHGAGDTPRLVVVVDQFEEVFTSCLDEAERSAFIAALGAVAGGSVKPVPVKPVPPAALVALGLRADFYSQALRRADLLPALAGHVVVEPMTEGELRDAIVKPAEKAKVDIEDGLVELLLHDLHPGPGANEPPDNRTQDGRTEFHDSPAHEAGTLPLLSHALDVTSKHLKHGRMTVAEYRAGGGIRGALTQTAEKAYGKLTSQQQEAARQLFLRLVHIADDTADTRRRLSHTELSDSYGNAQSEELAAVLRQFVDRRLITVGRDHVEIAHDALVSAWPRLREWVNDDRARLMIIRRLAEDARVWEANERDPSRLYRGNQLALAEEQTGSAGPIALPQVARHFLKASVAARRRWAYVRSAVTAVMAILLVLSAIGYLLAYQAKNDRGKDISRALASESAALRVEQPYLSLMLGIEAYRIAHTTEARNSLLDSQRSYKMTPLECGQVDRACHTDAVVAVRWVSRSDGMGVLMTAGRDGKVNVWRTTSDSSRPVRETVFYHGSPIQTATLSPDGATVVTAGRNGSVRGWDINTGHKILDIDNSTDNSTAVNDVAFYPRDPGVVATASDDGVVRLWRLASGKKPIATLRADDDSLPVYAVAFSPDSRLLATAHRNGTVKLWTVRDPYSAPKPFKTLVTQRAPYPVRVLAFSPDSRSLAIGIDVDVLLCETSTESLNNHDDPVCLIPVAEPAGPVRTLIFSPGLGTEGLTGGDKLLVGADYASIRLLDVPTRAVRSIYTGPIGNVLGVAFSPDGKTIAAAGSDNTAGLWDVQAEPEDETGDGSPPRRSTENPKPDDVIDWVCRYHPTPVLPRWPISAEFRRDIC